MMCRDTHVRDADIELTKVFGYLLDGSGDGGFRAHVGLASYDFLACDA